MSEAKQIEELKRLWYKRNPRHDDNADTGEDMFWKTVLCVFNDLNKALNIPVVTKRIFNFDYCGKAYLDSKNNWVADSIIESIEAWDEEHATLLFKEMHPGEGFDPVY